MRRLTTLMVLVVAILTIAAMGGLVSEKDQAPYYNTLDGAVAAAAEGQFIVVDFYTDW